MSLGERLRQLRAARRLSGAALARRAGLSPSLVSQVERDLTSPSLEALRRLAQALEVPMGALFDLPDSPASFGGNGYVPPSISRGVHVVRRDERKSLRLPRSRRVYELLTPDLQGRLQFVWVELEPGESGPAEGFRHAGEESILLLSGRMIYHVAGQQYELFPGDCITFDASLPHYGSNPGEETATMVCAITPPSF